MATIRKFFPLLLAVFTIFSFGFYFGQHVDGDVSSFPVFLASTPGHKQRHQLLLVTKGRSGSSFISILIKRDPRVFFTFEPFFLSNSHGQRQVLFENTTSDVLKFYLQCDVTGISANDLKLGRYEWNLHEERFIRCEGTREDGFRHIQCLLDYVRSCQSYDVTFAKVIRMPMRFGERLLQEMPNLKIMYLIRDPRAVLYSQGQHLKATGPNFNWAANHIQQWTEKHCKEIEEDLNEAHRLNTLYPGRILTLRYENVATETITYAKEIYKFAGLKFTNKTYKFVSDLSVASRMEEQLAFGVKRSNVTTVINKWRLKNGSYKSALLVDRFCGKLYDKLGYVKITSRKQMLSMKEPLYKKGFRIF